MSSTLTKQAKTMTRPCIDCKVSIENIPRRTRCIECYKQKQIKTKVCFIKEDEDNYEIKGETMGDNLK